MSRQALRVGDPVLCTCNPACPGLVVQGSNKTFINGRGAVRLGDRTTNCCGCFQCPCPNRTLKGSNKTFVDGRPMVRVGDPVSVGQTVIGSLNTFVG